MKNKFWIGHRFRDTSISKGGLKILVLSSFIAVLLGLYSTMYEIEYLKKNSFENFKFRVQLIDSYIKFYSSAIRRFSDGMEENLELPAYARNKLDGLKIYPEKNIYGIYDSENLSGNISGYGTDKLDSEIKKEMISVLMLDKQFDTLKRHFPQILWIYYISKKEFIYLTPKVSIDRFIFDEYFYNQQFWLLTNAKNNPNYETTITPLYKDLAGKGLMITISSPVVSKGEFRGIFCLDIGIGDLQDFLISGNSLGETIIVSRDSNLVAKKGLVKIAEKYTIPKALKVKKEIIENSVLWVKEPLTNSWLSAVHKIDLKEVRLIAFKDTFYIWVILALSILLEYLSLKLVGALKEATLFIKLDPLTRILNRRGFYIEYEKVKKEYKNISILVIDIDYFKKINDSFGHGVGDEILVRVSALLTFEKKKDEIYCRWGGEEFVILLPEKSEKEIIEFARDLSLKLNQNIEKPDGETITVSIGVSMGTVDENIEEIIKNADENLYKAKGSGRNCIYYNGNIYRNDKSE